jgi:hypothetical protein
MPLKPRIDYTPVPGLEVYADLVAADGVAVLVGNIRVLERAVIARVLVVIDDVVAIEVFHDEFSAASRRLAASGRLIFSA